MIRHQCQTVEAKDAVPRHFKNELHIMRRWIPDWLAWAAGFEPLHSESEIRHKSQLVMPIVM